METITAYLGAGYDYGALVGSQLLNLRRENPERWFCSEICAHALGMTSPHRYAPGDLYRSVLERNQIFALGAAKGKAPEESRAPS